MKNITLILVIVFLIIQVLFLNFDNLTDFELNKRAYISILIGILLLFIIVKEKKK
jgi:hypothetical protein